MKARNIRRVALGAVAAAALLPIGQASAGDGNLAAVFGIYYSTIEGTPVAYNSGDGRTHLLSYYSAGKTAASSQQALVGYLDSKAFVGVAYNHQFDRTANTGAYDLTGRIDGTGLATGLPLEARVTTTLDRAGVEVATGISGTIAGVPFSTNP